MVQWAPDKNKEGLQTWEGRLKRSKDSESMRIYGTWSGAYLYMIDKEKGFNQDFMMMKAFAH
jgi:hypothetical protein